MSEGGRRRGEGEGRRDRERGRKEVVRESKSTTVFTYCRTLDSKLLGILAL